MTGQPPPRIPGNSPTGSPQSHHPTRPAGLPPPPESPAKRALWGCGGAAGCLGVLALIVIIPALVTAGTIGGAWALLAHNLGSIVNPAPPSAAVASSATIVNQVRPLGQLVSTRAQVAKADIAITVSAGRFSQCGHSANHVAQATIEAGIDLLGVDESAVAYDPLTDTYTLTLPSPVITSCRVDFIDQYQRSAFVPGCTVDWDDLRQIAQYESLKAFREDALEGGLLITAERDAQLALTSFIGALTGSSVEVIFVDVALDERGSGCDPELPRDWQFNAQMGTWTRTR